MCCIAMTPINAMLSHRQNISKAKREQVDGCIVKCATIYENSS